MIYADIVILVVMLVASVRGLFNGLVHELFSVVGIILGIYVSSIYYSQLSVFFVGAIGIGTGVLIEFVSFVLLSVFIWVLSLIIASVVSKFIFFGGFRLVNCLGGYVFAFFKFVVIVSMVLNVLMQITFFRDLFTGIISQSSIYPIFEQVADRILSLDPVNDLYLRLWDRPTPMH